MTDDIVTRLRNSCDHLCIGCTEENAHDVGLEAASRIERLHKAGKIRFTDQYRPSRRRHATPIRVWELV